MKKSIHETVSQNRHLFAGLASSYSTLCLVDLETGDYDIIKTVEHMQEYIKSLGDEKPSLCDIFLHAVKESYHYRFIEFANIKVAKRKLAIQDTTVPIILHAVKEGGKWVNIQWLIAERDENGMPVTAFMAVSSVDEEKLEQTREMKEIADTIDVAQMGLWRIELFDEEMPRMKASKKMLELLGLKRTGKYSQEAIYEAWHSRICPEALDSVNASVQKMINGKQDENTYKWNHPTLGERYVRCGGVAYKEPGRGYVLVGYHYDVTEQLAIEMENNFVATSLANTYACLYYLDIKADSYVACSNNVSNVAKIIPDKGVTSTTMDRFAEHLCHEDYTGKIREFTDLSTIDERMKNTNRIACEFKGATLSWCEAAFIACDRNADGSINHVILAIKDLSEEKNAELEQIAKLKAYVEASKAKTRMLQNMSHEIRTPLNAMFGFSQLLSLPDGSLSDDEKAEYFNYIYNSFNMLSMHIDDVLDIANAEHGNYRITIGDVDVNEVCRNSMQMAESRKQERVNMYFTTDLEDGYTIQSDGRRIQQVLVNYLTNACKHTFDGEIHLHVSKTETPGRLTFSVADTGEGIPSEMADDIFVRFKKLNAQIQGSGIGLNICSIIAEKLNGEVKLDTSYTEGARFIFII